MSPSSTESLGESISELRNARLDLPSRSGSVITAAGTDDRVVGLVYIALADDVNLLNRAFLVMSGTNALALVLGRVGYVAVSFTH